MKKKDKCSTIVGQALGLEGHFLYNTFGGEEFFIASSKHGIGDGYGYYE
jgi:hypothetical protein